MRVLMLTQCLDENDWLVGFIPPWVNELARHVDRVDALALKVGVYAPPPNVQVYSMGKEQGRGRLGLIAGFYRAALPLIRQADAVFIHMIPRYAVLCAPLARLARKPMTMWYVHRHVNLELRLALLACRSIVTAAPDSFPLATRKVRVLGHGIDTEFFSPLPAHDTRDGDHDGNPAETLPAILHVGRLSPIKNHAALLRALAQGADAQAVLIGDVPEKHDTAYVDSLKTLASELGIRERVTFTGGLPARQVRDWYRRAAAAVNLTPAGSFDKAVLESFAAGIPTIVSHHGFDALLGDHAPKLRIDSPEDVDGLAARLTMLLDMPLEERRTMGHDLRQRVIDSHSLRRLMTQLVSVLKTGEPFSSC